MLSGFGRGQLGAVDGAKTSELVKQKIEDSLELFLTRLPSWRCGQCDAARAVPSPSPDRGGDAPAEASRSGSRRRPWKQAKERSRSRSRRRPSPVPAPPRKGSLFDLGPQYAALPTLAMPIPIPIMPSVKEKKKDKKDRRRDSSESRGRRSGSRRRKKDRKKDRSGSRSSSGGRKRLEKSRPAPPIPLGVPTPTNVPDWLADLVGPTAGMVRPRVLHREVMVPQQYVARLIGKGGEVIMGICNHTGADVKIRQETKDLGYSLAIITGHPDAMDVAERMVRQKLGAEGLTGANFTTKELPISGDFVGAVLGPKGATLAEIRQRAGNLQVDIRAPELPGLPHRAILGPGSPEQIALVEQLISAKLAEAALKAQAARGIGPPM